MVLDCLSLICVVGYGLLGLRRGAAIQVVRLASLVGALYVARATAPAIRGTSIAAMGLGELPTQVILFAIIATTTYIILRLIAYPIHSLISGGRDELSLLNRILGGVLSSVVAAVFLYALISTTLVMNARFGNPLASTPVDPASSVTAQLCSQHNLLGALRIPHREALTALAEAKIRKNQGFRADPDKEENPFDALIYHDKARFLNDPALLQAILDEQWSRIIAEPAIWRFLTDPEVVDTILARWQEPRSGVQPG